MGDLALISDKWLGSLGATQVRMLRFPQNFGGDARFRVAEEHYPFNEDGTVDVERVIWQFAAAWGISQGGTRYDLWSVHPDSRHNRLNGDPNGERIETAATRRFWQHYHGGDQPLRVGHPLADRWFQREASSG